MKEIAPGNAEGYSRLKKNRSVKHIGKMRVKVNLRSNVLTNLSDKFTLFWSYYERDRHK